MLDVAWPELMVIGAVVLVAIGPKDLPKAMYTLGRFAGRVRGFIADARHMMDQVTYEAEVAQRMKDAPPAPAPTPEAEAEATVKPNDKP